MVSGSETCRFRGSWQLGPGVGMCLSIFTMYLHLPRLLRTCAHVFIDIIARADSCVEEEHLTLLRVWSGASARAQAPHADTCISFCLTGTFIDIKYSGV